LLLEIKFIIMTAITKNADLPVGTIFRQKGYF